MKISAFPTQEGAPGIAAATRDGSGGFPHPCQGGASLDFFHWRGFRGCCHIQNEQNQPSFSRGGEVEPGSLCGQV